jgi:hypothetical protein
MFDDGNGRPPIDETRLKSIFTLSHNLYVYMIHLMFWENKSDLVVIFTFLVGFWLVCVVCGLALLHNHLLRVLNRARRSLSGAVGSSL